MGCDIHIATEVRQADGSWKRVDQRRWEQDWSWEKEYGTHRRCRIYRPYWDEIAGADRNYRTFAILADVRQRSPMPWYCYRDLEDPDFAQKLFDAYVRKMTGTEEDFDPDAIQADIQKLIGAMREYMYRPIRLPRGIPDDCAPETREEIDRWDSDGHTHSWLTLGEILLYDWKREAEFVDKVPQRIAKRAEEVGMHQAWDEYAADHGEEAAFKLWEDERVEVRYRLPYYVLANEFYCKTIPALQALGGPNDVRIVFFFDN